MNLFKKFRKIFRGNRFNAHYRADGFGVRNKNTGFMTPEFCEAYSWSLNFEHEGKTSPWRAVDLDIRWRTHVCAWAVRNALQRKGHLVECGVDTGIFAGAIARLFDFAQLDDRKYFLFDTYNGIPEVEGMTAAENVNRDGLNKAFYFDSYEFVRAKMAPFSNIEIVRGVLPETLSAIGDEPIAYLSVDLNNAPSEQRVIERLWPNLVTGAIVVIDDYAFRGHDDQYAMWNAFAEEQNLMVCTLPTGQGLLLKP